MDISAVTYIRPPTEQEKIYSKSVDVNTWSNKMKATGIIIHHYRGKRLPKLFMFSFVFISHFVGIVRDISVSQDK